MSSLITAREQVTRSCNKWDEKDTSCSQATRASFPPRAFDSTRPFFLPFEDTLDLHLEETANQLYFPSSAFLNWMARITIFFFKSGCL